MLEYNHVQHQLTQTTSSHDDESVQSADNKTADTTQQQLGVGEEERDETVSVADDLCFLDDADAVDVDV